MLAPLEQPEPLGSVACLPVSPRASPDGQGREQGCKTPRRSGQGWGMHSQLHLTPQLMKSCFPWCEQRAAGTKSCCGTAQGRAAVHRHSTPALGSRHAPLLGIAPSQIAPLLPLQQDVRLAKATGENWHFINCVCVCK